MKYMISWQERPQGSAIEYENAQKRVLEVFKDWQPPASVTILQFLVRVGSFGGYMLLETNDVAAIQKSTSTFPAFQFSVEALLDIKDAVAAEMEAIAWRDSLKRA